MTQFAAHVIAVLAVAFVSAACTNTPGAAGYVFTEQPAATDDPSCGPIESVADLADVCDAFGGVTYDVERETFRELACRDALLAWLFFPYDAEAAAAARDTSVTPATFELVTDECRSTYAVELADQ